MGNLIGHILTYSPTNQELDNRLESTINRMLTVVLPDGSRKQIEGPATAYDVAAGIGPGLAKAAILA